ncbi:MAG: TRAP transporter TatT component family protein [Treponema sp.]|nr:TRAP transporter TatT component family protein [Treponema sp.]
MMLNRYVLGAMLSLVFLGSSCSINRMALNAVADALTGDGGSEVFTAESDPELVGDAIPFALKMYESLLSQAPDHQGLILTTGSLFVMYANAFVQGPSEFLPPLQYEEREAAMKRAKALYLRGADILQGGLEKKYPGIGRTSAESGTMAPYLAKMKKADVPLLYWAAAGCLSAYSLDPFDFPLSRKVADAMAYIDRAYALDPDFNRGALDDFYVLALASLPDTMGGDLSRVETHFKRSVEKSGGHLAGPYVSYAQAVAVPAQDYPVFKQYLETALALDVDADPPNRLVNIISQRKARALLDNAENFFILLDDEEYE